MNYKVFCQGVTHSEVSCDQYLLLNDFEDTIFECENDYTCPNCLNEEEMHLHDWYDDTDDSYALASAGHGMDEDY